MENQDVTSKCTSSNDHKLTLTSHRILQISKCLHKLIRSTMAKWSHS